VTTGTLTWKSLTLLGGAPDYLGLYSIVVALELKYASLF
jgi:hypothetical protein